MIGFIKEETRVSVPFPGEAGGLSCPGSHSGREESVTVSHQSEYTAPDQSWSGIMTEKVKAR